MTAVRSGVKREAYQHLVGSSASVTLFRIGPTPTDDGWACHGLCCRFSRKFRLGRRVDLDLCQVFERPAPQVCRDRLNTRPDHPRGERSE